MATQAQPETRKAVRAALEAEGFSEADIQHVIDAMRPVRPPLVEYADDDWSRQLRSTRACAQTKI